MVFEALEPSYVHVWRAQPCTFDGPGASNTTKIPREDTQREKKNETGAGDGKKAKNFGRSGGRGSGGKGFGHNEPQPQTPHEPQQQTTNNQRNNEHTAKHTLTHNNTDTRANKAGIGREERLEELKAEC